MESGFHIVNINANAYIVSMVSLPTAAAIRAWARLERAHRATQTTVENRLKAAALPPLAWYDVLLELERVGDAGLRPYELRKAMLFAQYNLSRLIDRLESAGYVTRQASEEDGRGQILTITKAGRAMRRKIWPVYAAAIEDAVGRHLSDVEAQMLSDLLGRLFSIRP
jgi:DNA-binding MarR family transcriptional regulator